MAVQRINSVTKSVIYVGNDLCFIELPIPLLKRYDLKHI